ncbi:MAG: hypothetical protein ABWJ42_03050 [Sulfolobales archaeon]
MRIEFIAFESFGVRSMSTFVETDDITIHIDPGVALAPRRYGLPPHEIELKRLEELAGKIYERAREAEMIIVTHYHFDHHDRGRRIPLDIYDGKKVFIKDPGNNINYSQRVRSSIFLKLIKDRAREISVCEEKSIEIGSTRVVFSEAQPHGSDPKLGYVVQVFIRDKEDSFLHSSDIEGAPLEPHTNWIISMRPEVLLIDGPLTYMLGYKLSNEDLDLSKRNIIKILREARPRVLILEHHLLRDKLYRDRMREVYEEAERLSIKVYTAAEFMGRENQFLEAYRDQLYGVSREEDRGDLED